MIGEGAIERLVIQQGVTRPGWPPEATTSDEDLLCATLKMFGFVIFCEARRHGRTNAGADKDIEHHAALTKGLVDSHMRGSEASAAGRNESNRSTGQKTDHAVDINLIFKGDMVMQEDGQPSQPRSGAANLAASSVMNANESPR